MATADSERYSQTGGVNGLAGRGVSKVSFSNEIKHLEGLLNPLGEDR